MYPALFVCGCRRLRAFWYWLFICFTFNQRPRPGKVYPWCVESTQNVPPKFSEWAQNMPRRPNVPIDCFSRMHPFVILQAPSRLIYPGIYPKGTHESCVKDVPKGHPRYVLSLFFKDTPLMYLCCGFQGYIQKVPSARFLTGWQLDSMRCIICWRQHAFSTGVWKVLQREQKVLLSIFEPWRFVCAGALHCLILRFCVFA